MRSTAGLVDAHSHLRSTALADHGVQGSCLEEALLRMNAMTGVDPYDDALVAASDHLASGITGIQVIFHTFGSVDHYLGVLDRTIAGLTKIGIRARITLAITDQFEFLPQRTRRALQLPAFINTGAKMAPADFQNLVERAIKAHPNVAFGIAPVAPQWCSDAMLAAIAELATDRMWVHTHCLESVLQRTWYEESPIDRLARFGLLRANTSLAHAIHLTDRELDLVAASGTKLVTCPRSNEYLRAGRADLSKWISRKIDFGIGLDSVAGRESAAEVAARALSDSEALIALTSGGSLAAGVDSSKDLVTWGDWENGIADSVSIDGNVIAQGSDSSLAIEVEAARARITSALATDRGQRAARHRELDQLMPEYLEVIKG